jgi:hypothetical protein
MRSRLGPHRKALPRHATSQKPQDSSGFFGSFIGHVCPRWSGVIGVMAAWRLAIELSPGDADTAKLRSIAQSRTEPASRVERAQIMLAYREGPSFFAVGRARAASPDRPALRRARGGLRPASCARRSPSPWQVTDDHAGGQGMVGVAGVPEGEGPRLSPQAVDDPASCPPRSRAWTGGGAAKGFPIYRCCRS